MGFALRGRLQSTMPAEVAEHVPQDVYDEFKRGAEEEERKTAEQSEEDREAAEATNHPRSPSHTRSHEITRDHTRSHEIIR